MIYRKFCLFFLLLVKEKETVCSTCYQVAAAYIKYTLHERREKNDWWKHFRNWNTVSSWWKRNVYVYSVHSLSHFFYGTSCIPVLMLFRPSFLPSSLLRPLNNSATYANAQTELTVNCGSGQKRGRLVCKENLNWHWVLSQEDCEVLYQHHKFLTGLDVFRLVQYVFQSWLKPFSGGNTKICKTIV